MSWPLPLALALALLLTPAAISRAQEDEKPAAGDEEPQATISEDVVVTATRSEASVDTIGSSVTLITPQEIEQRRPTAVVDVLETVPGLEITQSGGPGTIANVYLRGAAPSQTLVLIDGVRANSTTLGSFDLSDLRAENVERIEIVRGPQSTLYGSEAMGGVINLITRAGGEKLRRFGVELGSESFYKVRASLGGGDERIDYSLAAGYERTDGISAASERAGNTEADGYRNLSASLRLGFAFLGNGRGDLTVRFVDSQTELDGFDFFLDTWIDDLNYSKDRQSLFTTLSLRRQVTKWWNQTVLFSFGDDGEVGHDPDTPFNNYALDVRNSEVTLLADLAPFDNDVLSLGYSVERREGVNQGVFDEAVDLRSYFVQNQWTFKNRLFLTAGLRNDDHSQSGAKTTYRATMALVAGSRTRIHTSFGTGLRVPSLNELLYPFFGNPDLVPETSRGVDLGVEQRLLGGDLVCDVTWFRNTFENLISFDSQSWVYANYGAAQSSGVEASMRVVAGRKFHLTASFTYLDATFRNPLTGEPERLARRPRRRGTLVVGFQPHERLSGTLSLVVVQDRIGLSNRRLEDYQRVDLSLSYRPADRFNLYARVQNLLDEDYEEIFGYTSPGFTPAAGLAVDF